MGAAVVGALETDASRYTWAATIGSQDAARYQLATGRPVMPLGGFNGSDPSPTLARFERDVAAGRVHWFIGAGTAPGAANGGSDAAARIAAWVEARFTPQTLGGVTLYDLGPAAQP